MSEVRHDWVKAQVGEYMNKPSENENEWITKALIEIQKKGKITNAQDVFIIQNALKNLGFTGTKIDQEFIIDAVFRDKTQKGDSETMRAIKSFQKEYKLRVDGQIGDRTLAKILEVYAERQKTPKTPELTPVPTLEREAEKKDVAFGNSHPEEASVLSVPNNNTPHSVIPQVIMPEAPKKPTKQKGFMDGFVDGVTDTANLPLSFLKNK